MGLISSHFIGAGRTPHVRRRSLEDQLLLYHVMLVVTNKRSNNFRYGAHAVITSIIDTRKLSTLM